MSDISRVPIPYGSQPVSNKTKNVTKRTIRLAVKLPQSNEDTCPEFNYKDELDAAKKRGSTKNIENGSPLDIFADDDDGDVRRIAMQMEEKYGKGVAVSKKRRRNRKDDYADIGMGYDESDSFIDNTDGYDEIIPQNVTTLHGGFYINCGALEFKTDDEESMDSSSDSSKSGSPSPRNGKRTLESDDSDGETDKPPLEKKSKVEFSANGMQKALKKKLFSPNKIMKKKRSSSNLLKKTVKDLLKEKRKDLNLTVLDNSEADIMSPVLSSGGDKNVENDKVLSSSITDAIESVVKASDEPIQGADRVSSQSNDDTKLVQLPENLPNNISEVISKIKQTALNWTSGTRFTDDMNSLLLSFERKSKCLGKPSKTKVYEHLSYCIKVEKQVLIQHCTQLAMKDEEKKIKSLIQKLKSEIDKVMPSIINNYEKECDLVLEKRTLLQLQSQDGGEEKKKSIGRPKRKFQWNDQTKKYLKDTATIKKRSYLQQGNSKESWEEELTNFLKNNVLHLWPEGWMTMTSLTKVCNKLFNDTKTANQPPSNLKKETKTTAISTPNLPYPNISITPVMSNVQNKTTSKTKTIEPSRNDKGSSVVHKEHAQKENNSQKEPLLAKEKEKIGAIDLMCDKKNNNGHTFVKVDYNKTPPPPFNSRPKELLQELKEIPKFPNVNIIELDGSNTNNFTNLLPKTKPKSASDFDTANCSSSTVKSVPSENKCIKDIKITELEKRSNIPEENHRNLSDSDDIQKVMERLKNLQKMSSPVKTFEGSSSSNTGFAQKNSAGPKNNLDFVTPSFQDEFQKQLLSLSAMGNLPPNTSKSNYKCS